MTRTSAAARGAARRIGAAGTGAASDETWGKSPPERRTKAAGL
ncbi:hypothetical protein ACFSR7_35220 [Cohnella sp. GCM10020058]